MLRSDSRREEFNPDTIIGNNDTMNNDMISEIEKELIDNPYDMISLVFLLYDVPDTALQRLIVFQRVSKDPATATNLNMLHEWFQHAKHTPTWKHEFIEALLLCQLFSIAKKLGVNISATQNYYQTDNLQTKMYINPIKKALYKLCENMNADNFFTLKKSLLSYEIDTADLESCEMVILKLMCDKFITVNQFHYNKKTFGFQAKLDKLVRIVENLSGLHKFAQDLKSLQQFINEDFRPCVPIAISTPSAPKLVEECVQSTSHSRLYNTDFEDAFGMIGELSLEDNANIKTLKSDRTRQENENFEIINHKRLGVCAIINQKSFYPSKNSIENANHYNALAKRNGSDKDEAVIRKTMSALNFAVHSKSNLNREEMFEFLINILETEVTKDDSAFMLCILSHGVRGHVYAADSVKVNIDDIQKLLESKTAKHLHGKPKLMIIQACQVDETQQLNLVADNPRNGYCFEKTDFLIYWATAPDLEAYRDENQGSIFIQRLFRIIQQYADKKHILDIFTKATLNVRDICRELGCPQVPICHTTMTKNLYLKVPQR